MKQHALKISLFLLFSLFPYPGLVGFTIIPNVVIAPSTEIFAQNAPVALTYGTYLMDNPNIVYSGSDWTVSVMGEASTSVQFAMAMWLIEFDTPGYLVVHYRASAEAGSIQIQIDGNQPEEAFSLSTETFEEYKFWVSSQITPGTHTIYLSSLEAKSVYLSGVEVTDDPLSVKKFSFDYSYPPAFMGPITETLSVSESDLPAIVAGDRHACYLTRNGGVKCWGNNLFSQLGRGSNTEPFINQPDYVMNLSENVKKIAAGDNHNCAIMNDGTVKCWGKPAYGQLGVGNLGQTKRQPDPLPVEGLSAPAIEITAGANHSCVLIPNGIVQCWGDNSFGQLGFKSDSKYIFSAGQSVELAGEAVEIDAGGDHTCAILKTGITQCWGKNDHGQLGNGSTISSFIPVQVGGLSNTKKLTGGRAFTCAITGDAVKCWGENTSGQLGNNSTTDSPIPVSVAGINSGVFSISAGGQHACSISRTQSYNNEVQCWGDNRKGQLGNHLARDQYYLKPIHLFNKLDGGISISAGGEFICSVYSDGSGSCWGDYSSGQNGSGLDGWRVFDLQDGICGDVWSGKILENGNPLEGVIVHDGNGHETMTDTSGQFCFLDLIPGIYTIKPIQEAKTFAPSSETVNLVNGMPENLHFERNP